MIKNSFPYPPSSSMVLQIDLDALVHNYRTLCSKLTKKTLCSAVLKANAYGMGVKEAAPVLYKEGCRHFFVAHLSEGIEIKNYIGADSSVYILNGLRKGDEEVYAHYNLIPILSDPYQIHLWNSYCQNTDSTLKAALHFDTGMTRTGLSPQAVENLGLLQISHMEIVTIISHLSCAYQPSQPMNASQRELFEKLCSRFPFATKSLANSGGIFLNPSYHFDMVRPGLALLGCRSAVPVGPCTLKPVMKAYGQVLQIHEITPGDPVGYDATFIASRSSRIATLGVGYGDGYLRSLSNKGKVYYNGNKLPVVGKVSMDLIAVDVTDVPDSKIYPGDWVELFGEHVTIDDVASMADTIPWEISTRLGPRFERFYINKHNTIAETA